MIVFYFISTMLNYLTPAPLCEGEGELPSLSGRGRGGVF